MFWARNALTGHSSFKAFGRRLYQIYMYLPDVSGVKPPFSGFSYLLNRNWNEYNLNLLTRNDWSKNLVPAAAVIQAPIVYQY